MRLLIISLLLIGSLTSSTHSYNFDLDNQNTGHEIDDNRIFYLDVTFVLGVRDNRGNCSGFRQLCEVRELFSPPFDGPDRNNPKTPSLNSFSGKVLIDQNRPVELRIDRQSLRPDIEKHYFSNGYFINPTDVSEVLVIDEKGTRVKFDLRAGKYPVKVMGRELGIKIEY